GPGVDLELDHGDAGPAEPLEERPGGADEAPGRRHALAVDADATGGRLFPEPFVGEDGAKPPLPHQQEDADPRSHDALLEEERKRRGWILADALHQLVGVGRVPDLELVPPGAVTGDGAVRLDHERVTDPLGDGARVLVRPAEGSLLRREDPHVGGYRQDELFVREGAKDLEVREWKCRIAQAMASGEEGEDRRLGDREDDV